MGAEARCVCSRPHNTPTLTLLPTLPSLHLVQEHTPSLPSMKLANWNLRVWKEVVLKLSSCIISNVDIFHWFTRLSFRDHDGNLIFLYWKACPRCMGGDISTLRPITMTRSLLRWPQSFQTLSVCGMHRQNMSLVNSSVHFSWRCGAHLWSTNVRGIPIVIFLLLLSFSP